MADGEAREGKWRGNWRMKWVASTLHTTSEHGVSNMTTITTADVHNSTTSSRLNWRPCRFKWTRPFRRKTKSGFCACAIIFHTQSICCMRCTFTAVCSRVRITRITHNRPLEERAVSTLWGLIWSICKSDYYGSFISLLTGRCIYVKSTLPWQALQNSRLWRMNSQSL
jgi:hypothetical protein